MRRAASVALVTLLGGITSTAQSPNLEIAISEGRKFASVEAVRMEPYQDGPWASIPPTALAPADEPAAADFKIRAWKEADRARVVVFAVTRAERRAGTDRETETQIATFLLAAGDSREVPETSKYAARPVTISARLRSPQ